MNIVQVLLPKLKLFPLDYFVPQDIELQIGDIVTVSFRNKQQMGVVWSQNKTELDHSKIKSITSKIPLDLKIDIKDIEFLRRASQYYMADLGSTLKIMLPVDLLSKPIKYISQEIPNDFSLVKLNEEQKIAYKIVQNSNNVSLIHGVTGSGKTELYYESIAGCLKNGDQALIMLPEISLTSQMIERFKNRFGFEPAIWNSSITTAQKKQILRGVILGTVKLIIGTRSSLFLPYKNLKIIVVDEEHDASYKQEEGINYNARDMAVLKGSIFNFKVILASATPSIESMHNALIKKYDYIKINSRYSDSQMPEIRIIDLLKEKLPYGSWISKTLNSKINQTLNEKKQVLLFLNRKGYSPLMLCSNCSYRFSCVNCSSWLVYHKEKKSLECHHCGYLTSVKKTCPECNLEDMIRPCGPGVERIYEEIQNLFPNANTHIITKDETRKTGALEVLINKVHNGEIDILIGTQIITKGYDFPSLSLVGIIDADISLMSASLRSTERTFQLLQQVGGRAGRRSDKGFVYIQTYYKDNSIMNLIKSGNFDEFYKNELKIREASGMPPFTKSALILVDSKIDIEARKTATKIVNLAPKIENIKVLGPAHNDIAIINKKHIYKIFLIAPKTFNIQKYIANIFIKIPSSSKVNIKIDIDPYKT